MGASRTLVLSTLASLAAALGPFCVYAASDRDDPTRMFAQCAGRLSALMEHQWIVDGPASEATKRQRDAVVTLLDAVALPDSAPAVMQWRIEAKVAQAALLTQARLGRDRQFSLRAYARAQALTAPCIAMVLEQS